MFSRGIQLTCLLLLVLGVYLAGNGRTQLFDRDEPRYAQCSRQMLQSGDWVVPRLYDKLRPNKPPGIYWCQATAMSVLGDNAFAARLPSALATVLVCLLLGIGVWREVGSRQAVWAIFILASSALMFWSGKNCLTDAVLLLCTTVSLGSIYLLWRGRGGWPTVIALSTAIGCGGLVKGPFILGVLAATVVALVPLAWLDRRLHRRRAAQSLVSATAAVPVMAAIPSHERANGPADGLLDYRSPAPSPSRPKLFGVLFKLLVGLAVVAAVVLPWIYMVQHRAPQFLHAAKADAVAHLENGSEGHTGPPGYHLALIWVTYLPWSLLLPLTLVVAIKNWRLPPVRFALAAVLGTWVFVEIVQTKLPHYILPAFPALAFLTADAIVRCLRGERNDLVSKPNRIVLGSVALLAIFISAGPWWLAIKFHQSIDAPLLALTAFALIYGVTAGTLFFTRRPGPALVTLGLGSMGLAVLLFVVYLPNCQPMRLPIRIADVLKYNGAVHLHDAVMFEYKEPSLAFYQGGTIREYDQSLAQLALTPDAPRFAVIPTWVWDAATPQTRDAFTLVAGPLTGWDYSDNGKTAHVLVLRKN